MDVDVLYYIMTRLFNALKASINNHFFKLC